MKKIKLIGLDKLLVVMFKVQTLLSPKKFVLSLGKTLNNINEDINKQKSAILRVLYSLFLPALGLLVSIPLFALFLAINIIISSVTVAIVTPLVMILGILYGFFPFLIKYEKTDIDEDEEKVIYKGYHKVKYPITVSIDFGSSGRTKLLDLAMAPIYKINNLNNDFENAHILNRMSLSIATLLSNLIYSGLIFVFFHLITYIIIFLLGITLGTIWFIINFIVNMNNIDKENDQSLDEEELEEGAKYND